MGLEPTDIAMLGDPVDVCKSNSIKIQSFLTSEFEGELINSSTCDALIRINDKLSLDERLREEEITKIFKENGVKVNFK